MIESFDDAMAFMRKAITDDCDQTYCAMYDDDCYACEGAVLDRLQRAHEHEMEQLRRLRFREGYEAGQRSMDAEHYAVALRLKHLPLDEDSHGNLSQIARAVWHSDFGWTKGACEALRDELVRLLGGVHDEPAPIPASRCTCDADCDCHNQQPKAVAHDVLGNERNKTVCRLREWKPDEDNMPVRELWEAIMGEKLPNTPLQGDAELDIVLRDRLIHLIGGDEPLPNLSEPNLSKSVEVVKPESEDGGESTITDELRKFATDPLLGYASQELHVERITAIADRIDEQAKRDRESEQLRIEKLVEQRDETRQECDNLLDLLRDAVVDFEYASYSWNYALIVGENITIETERNSLLKERDELQHKLDELEKFDHDASIAAFGDDNEELRKLLSRASMLLANAEQDRDTYYAYWMDCKEKVVHGNATIEELEAKLDEYERHDTAESIVRDIHLGKVTDSQAVERIRALNG